MSGIKKFNAVQGFSVGESTIYDVIDNGANVTASNLVVNHNSHLGDIGNITITGGSAGYVLKTDGTGVLSWENPADVGVAGSNTQIQFNDGGFFGASSNLTYNKSTKTLTVDNIVGNGSGITSIYGPNVTDVVANANFAAYAGNVTVNAQPNITSVGTLSSLRVTANVTSGNANLGNLGYAQYLGGTLIATSAVQPNITSVGTLDNLLIDPLGNVTGANLVSASYLTGVLTTKAQPNITSVGTLSTLRVTQNVSSGNANLGNLVTSNYFTGDGYLLSNITGANITGWVGNADVANTVAQNSQPNITSVGTLTGLTVNGDLTITSGNLIVSGSLEYANVTTFRIKDPIIEQGGNTTGTPLTSNDGYDRGQLLHYYAGSARDAFMGWDNSNAEFAFGSNVSVASEVVTFNEFGNIRANYFLGNGSQLTGVIANANFAAYAGNITVNAQPNITSVGTLTTLNASGNITSGGNLLVTANVSSGNANLGNLVTANFFSGSGNLLSNVQAGNISGQVANALVAGTVYTNAQPNITSVGTLVSLNASGNITSGGNVLVTANVSSGNANLGNLVTANFFSGAGNLLSNIYGPNVSGWVPNANIANTVAVAAQPNITSVGTLVDVTMAGPNSLSGGNLVSANYVTGTLTTKVQPNITSVGTLTGLTVSGDTSITGNLTVSGAIEIANVTTFKVRDPLIEQGGTTTGSPLTSNDGYDRGQILHYYSGSPIDAFMGWDNSNAEFSFGSNVSVTNEVVTFNELGNIRANNFLGNIVSSTLTGQLTTNNQPNITSVGTLSTLNVAGNITSGGNVLVTANLSSGNANLGNLITANYYTGTLTTGTQPNITSVGTLTTANVSGNITSGGNVLVTANVSSGNANLGNLVTANYFSGSGNLLSNIQASNISGQVANALVAGTVYTNAQPNITSLGSLSGLTVSNATGVVNFTTTANVSLGSVSNVHITGGTNGYVLSTDGAGNLTWESPTLVGVSGGNTQVQFNDNSNFAGSANFTFDKSTNILAVNGQIKRNNLSLMAFVSSSTAPANPVAGDEWYDRDNDIIYKYIYDGTSSYWVDVSSGYIGANVAAIGNTLVQRDANANVTANYFIGNGSMLTGVGSAGGLSNGTSNINAGTVNGNITVGIAGVANTIIFTSTGINTIATGGINAGNVLTANYVTGTLTTAAQPNITSVGTLVNTTLGGANSLTGGNLLSANYVTGTLITAAQPNITSVGTLTTLTSGTHTISANSNIAMSGTLSQIAGANLVSATYLTGTLTTGAQPNITSHGSLIGLTVSNATGVVDFTTTANVTLGAVGNLHITGGTSGQVLSTNGSGGLSWTTISGAAISNGTSNITAGTVNGNITVGIGGTANTVVFASTGVNVAGYANVVGNLTAGNISTAGVLTVTGNANIGADSNVNFVWGNSTIINNFDNTYRMGMSLISNSRETRLFATGGATANDGGNITFYTRSAAGSSTSDVGSEKARINTLGLNVSTTTAATTTSTGAIITAGGLGVAGNAFVGGIGNFAGNVNGANLTTPGQVFSTIATGTAPLSVSSTTRVANLNVAYANVADYGVVTAQTTGTFYPVFVNGNTTANYAHASNTNINVSVATGAFNATLLGGTLTTAAQPNITSTGTLASLTVTGNITGGNANLGNLVTANYFTGNGSLLTSITGANVTGTVANANVANTVAIGAQPNITSTGTLTGLTVSGNITSGTGTGGNLVGANNISANTFTGNLTTAAQPNITSVGTLTSLTISGNVTSGNANLGNLVTANFFSGAGNLLSNIVGGNVSGQVGNALVAGTVYTNAQPNITSVGTLASLTVTANISSGNANLGNLVTANYYTGTLTTGAQPNITSVGTLASLTITGNLTSGNANLGNLVTANYYTGTLTTGAQPNITSVGTLASLTVTGNISSGNANLGNLVTANFFSGSGNLLSNIQASNITGTIANANYAAYAGNVTLAAQPNITSVGTLASLTVSGNITSGGASGGNISGANNVSANTFTGNLTTAAQPNITSTGTLNGLTATGTINFTGAANVSLGSNTNVHITGGTSGQYLYTDGAGNLAWGTIATAALSNGSSNVSIPLVNGNVVLGVGGNTTMVVTTTGANITGYLGVTGNITTGNANLGNLVTANFFSGAGNLLSNIQGGNVSGQVSNALVAGTVYTNAQPNITSVGTLSSLTVTANISSGNADLGNLVTANFFSGSGNLLANIQGANVSGQVGNALVAGTVYTNAQPNITSVGTLTSLTVTGNVSSGNADLGNLVTANYYTGTLTTGAQPNITSTGTLTSLTVSGDSTITGNLTVTGTFEYANVTSFKVKDPIIEQGGNPNGTALSSNDGYDRGQLLHYYSGSATDAFMGWDNSNAEFAFGSNVSVTNEVVTFNTFGNLRAGYFFGDGSQLTGVTATTATTAGTVTANAQPNITSVGTLSSLTVTANISSGNANLGNLVTANYFSGNGSLLTSITGGNVSGQVGNALVAGTVYTNAQPNITSVGTLSSLSVTANISSGNADLGNLVTANFFSGSGNLLANIQGANVSGQVGNALVAGTVYSNAQPNITSVGTLSSLSVTANISSGNANLGNLVTANFFSGNGSLLTSITGGNVSGQVGNALVAGTVYTNAQPNITSVGTLTSLDVTGNITAAYLIGNGSQLTGLPAGYANSNVDAYLPTYTGNISGNIITLTGNITAINANLGNLVTANFFSGSGNLLSNIQGANVSGQVGNALVAGTVYTNAQPNITSVGTLTSLTITGNVSSGNANLGNLATANFFSGAGNLLSNIAGGNVSGQVGNALVAGTVYTNAQPNITSVGTLSSLAVTANVTAGNVKTDHLLYANGDPYIFTTSAAGSNTQVQFNDSTAFAGSANFTFDKTSNTLSVTNIVANGAGLTNLNGSNVTGQVGNALVAGTVYTNAQPNITSVGTLSDLTVAGTTDLGSLANVKISGGGAGYSIITDGTGNLSWSASAGGGAASFVAISKDLFTGNGVADTFTLSVTPSSVQAIAVNINGILQLSTAYSLTGSDVTFGSAPASGVKIEVTTYGVVSFSGTSGQIQYSNGSGFASSSGLTFNSGTNALSVSGNGTFSGGYLTLDSGIIAVSSGNAGIFTSGIGNVNIGLAGNVTLGGTSSNVTARGNFVANTITSNTTISGDTVTATNLRMNDLYSNRTPINVTGTTVVDSFALNKYRTAKYTIRVGSDDGYQSIEALLIHDAVSSLITVYGSISTSGYDIVLLSSAINSGNVELLATTGSANTTVNLIGTYVAD